MTISKTYKRAIDLFGREEVELIIHAGDFVFPGVIDEFKNLKNKQPDINIIGVLGNNDGEKLVLLKKFNEMSGILEGEFIDTVIDGFRFGIYHGLIVLLLRPLFKAEFTMFLSMDILTK